MEHFNLVRFQKFKAFTDFSIKLQDINILVGPNNSGKSTILSAFRILAEGIRKAESRKPEIVDGPEGSTWGYKIDVAKLPLATENIFHNYNDTEPAKISFKLTNNNELLLFFPKPGHCNLICFPKGSMVRSTSNFKRLYNLSISFVPILGPVEHDERLFQKEAARKALLSNTASRNFRNIWHHYPDNFDKFKDLVIKTWKGMDIEKPIISYGHKEPLLHMFCLEERFAREIFWAGFGFQVWCQMLTYIVQARKSSLLIIDEPDIYLHSDLQRQLFGILKDLGPDILIATHSTEIINEADHDDLLLINKKNKNAQRIKDPVQLKKIYLSLGSNLNPILTQLAKTKKALFLEGQDYQIISKFARLLGFDDIANRSCYAVIPLNGFKPQMIKDYVKGIEDTLGSSISFSVLLDKDYRSKEECDSILAELQQGSFFSHILKRKEIENFLLAVNPIHKAILKRVDDRNKRTGSTIAFHEAVSVILENLSADIKDDVMASVLDKYKCFHEKYRSGIAGKTLTQEGITLFTDMWSNLNDRFLLIPGKRIFSELNCYLQDRYKIAISPSLVISSFSKTEVPEELINIITKLKEFCLL